MHRTEGQNPDVSLGYNIFKDGPPGTTVTDDWLNAVQEEIIKVITDGGLSPLTAATDTRVQLSAAIAARITATLAATPATELARGIIELATTAEVIAGTDSVRAVTPAGAAARVPAGCMLWWPTETPPTGWLFRNGAAISRSTYAALYAVIGTTYGVGDGATTFNLPDDRGRFMRAWADGQTTDPDRAARTNSGGGVTGDHVATLQADELESHKHTLTFLPSTAGSGNYPHPASTGGSYASDVSVSLTGGNETRPLNRAYLPIIKY